VCGTCSKQQGGDTKVVLGGIPLLHGVVVAGGCSVAVEAALWRSVVAGADV
jgi:hypothetical protein